jgi:hypothetical protein
MKDCGVGLALPQDAADNLRANINQQNDTPEPKTSIIFDCH